MPGLHVHACFYWKQNMKQTRAAMHDWAKFSSLKLIIFSVAELQHNVFETAYSFDC